MRLPSSIQLAPMDRRLKAELPIEFLAFVAVGIAFAVGTALGATLAVAINTIGGM